MKGGGATSKFSQKVDFNNENGEVCNIKQERLCRPL